MGSVTSTPILSIFSLKHQLSKAYYSQDKYKYMRCQACSKLLLLLHHDCSHSVGQNKWDGQAQSQWARKIDSSTRRRGKLLNIRWIIFQSNSESWVRTSTHEWEGCLIQLITTFLVGGDARTQGKRTPWQIPVNSSTIQNNKSETKRGDN